MYYDIECEVITQHITNDCMTCYRHDICKKWFTAHPEKIYCPDNLRQHLDVPYTELK